MSQFALGSSAEDTVWSGVAIKGDATMPIVIRLKEAKGEWTGSMDLPDTQRIGLPMSAHDARGKNFDLDFHKVMRALGANDEAMQYLPTLGTPTGHETAETPFHQPRTLDADDSDLEDELELLLRNAFLGLSLVLVVLGLFLEFKLAFWVTMGIPTAFLGGMLFLPLFGATINMISLFAFIIALGIVVDDAIVAGENIHEYRQKGMSFVDAVSELAQGVGMQVPQEHVSPDERQRRQRLSERRLQLTDVLQRAARHYRAQLKDSSAAVGYLKARGLSGEIAARFGIGYAPAGWHALASVFPDYDEREQRLESMQGNLAL